MRALSLLLVLVACRASATGEARRTRDVPIGAGLSIAAGPMIVDLPAEQGYRFVAPNEIVIAATSEDIASSGGASVLPMRDAIATVLHSQGWRDVGDSADYDITVFEVARTGFRREERTEKISTATSGLRRCDQSRSGQPASSCTVDEPVTERTYSIGVPIVTRGTVVVIRRRDDGAQRLWQLEPGNDERGKAIVARDLLRLLAAQGR